jgi:large subunit ribosomal protein L29
MKQSVIKELSNAELIERLDEEKKQLVRLKINHAVSPLENPIKIKEYRKTVARIKTEIRQRELNDNKKAE